MADLYYNVRIEGVTQGNYEKFVDYFENASDFNKITVASFEYSPITEILSFSSCGGDPEGFIKAFVTEYVVEVPVIPSYEAKTLETSSVHALKKEKDPKIIVPHDEELEKVIK